MNDGVRRCFHLAVTAAVAIVTCAVAIADDIGQPLGANAVRLIQALDYLGAPLPDDVQASIKQAAAARDALALQEALDSHVLLVVQINPELRVKVGRGEANARLRQNGFTPVIVKIMNGAAVSERLRIESPQAGAVYAGAALGILQRQQQTELLDNANKANDPNRFVEVEMFQSAPMIRQLSGLEVEYAIALIYSVEAGKREVTIGFNIGQGTQDIGFRGEVPVLFDVEPAVPVRLSIQDFDGTPTTARLTIVDEHGRIHPPQPKRLAPDFFFQPQIYRSDGESVLLTPGRYEITASRGPEYFDQRQSVVVPEASAHETEVKVNVNLKRWINPMEFGYRVGDHHIHAAGCSHYEIPTQGVLPEDMFAQVKGEGLNIGCVLTWGPCYDHQRQFFAPKASDISEPDTVLKYDLEISGFGSASLGHVCLLNLKDQTYPGSEGTKTKGWPTWTVPVMRWAREQGGVTGYPHSDLFVDPPVYARRFIGRYDADSDGVLTEEEAMNGLLPLSFSELDEDGDQRINQGELERQADRAANQLPNLVLPAMNGAGAMEIFVSATEGVCDFISSMNTGRIGEWNTWYHLLNCGFPIKLSGETDFPCMSSRRVGQGRTYVQMGRDNISDQVDFEAWCRGVAAGRSYVSDGFAHALEFSVAGVEAGANAVMLSQPGEVTVRARVAFAPVQPEAVAYGMIEPKEGKRHAGDTRVLHAPRTAEVVKGGKRLVEIVRNGEVVAQAEIPADGNIHDLEFTLPVDQSSWIALREFPQLHTNPVDVIIGGRPIRSSARSARWCAESVELLWENRHHFIAEAERGDARAAYDRAVEEFKTRALEAQR
ncbi:MAG: CehA/McbA family metallohydrolase [Verrucomicrobiales bacterium]